MSSTEHEHNVLPFVIRQRDLLAIGIREGEVGGLLSHFNFSGSIGGLDRLEANEGRGDNGSNE